MKTMLVKTTAVIMFGACTVMASQSTNEVPREVRTVDEARLKNSTIKTVGVCSLVVFEAMPYIGKEGKGNPGEKDAGLSKWLDTRLLLNTNLHASLAMTSDKPVTDATVQQVKRHGFTSVTIAPIPGKTLRQVLMATNASAVDAFLVVSTKHSPGAYQLFGSAPVPTISGDWSCVLFDKKLNPLVSAEFGLLTKFPTTDAKTSSSEVNTYGDKQTFQYSWRVDDYLKVLTDEVADFVSNPILDTVVRATSREKSTPRRP